MSPRSSLLLIVARAIESSVQLSMKHTLFDIVLPLGVCSGSATERDVLSTRAT